MLGWEENSTGWLGSDTHTWPVKTVCVSHQGLMGWGVCPATLLGESQCIAKKCRHVRNPRLEEGGDRNRHMTGLHYELRLSGWLGRKPNIHSTSPKHKRVYCYMLVLALLFISRSLSLLTVFSLSNCGVNGMVMNLCDLTQIAVLKSCWKMIQTEPVSHGPVSPLRFSFLFWDFFSLWRLWSVEVLVTKDINCLYRLWKELLVNKWLGWGARRSLYLTLVLLCCTYKANAF